MIPAPPMLNTVTTHLAAGIRRATTDIHLRDYQVALFDGIESAFAAGHMNVLAVLPTGGGKTVVFAYKLAQHNGYACAIAHRQELVSQISLALARYHVRHRIIAPREVVQRIIQLHVEEIGSSYYDAQSNIAVAGVDTLTSKKSKNDRLLQAWLPRVTLWVMDEAHHVLKANKWGKAVEMFPNARGLGVTATPIRADGRGLGRKWDGVFDEMVIGPSMRDLINMGFLTDYRIVCAPSDILEHLNPETDISETTGEWKQEALRKASKGSHIVGDVVKTYLAKAAGKLGITFATDIDAATDMAAKFNAAGVPAEVVSSETPDLLRAQILRRFRNRQLLMLVNVDLFGEGFDLPAIEVVIFARPTESLGLYMQQFGRGLRIMEGKEKALIIDHVGNVFIRHGLPDKPRAWSLAPREKRSKSKAGEVAMKYCLNEICGQPYERFKVACPYCGHRVEPAERSAPKFVDGDLVELDPAVLAKMRGEVEKVDGPAFIPRDATAIVAASIKKNHRERQSAQGDLREIIRWWAGMQTARGLTESETYRLFYLTFGVDVLSAQALGRPDATALAERVAQYVGKLAIGDVA